jgi:hypothetical protein
VNWWLFLKESRNQEKTNLNTMELAQSIFKWALYPEMDEKGYLNLKLFKTGQKEMLQIHKEGKWFKLLINIIYIKNYRAISNKSSLFSI